MPLSDNERKLLERWNTPTYGKPMLRKVEISGLRGLNNFSLDLLYPVIAIAGENGTGKSTILGCLACAYHEAKGFVPFDKNKNAPYYTFGDFIITSRYDVPYRNAEVSWGYSGVNYPQSFTAKKGKKWSKYDKRPKRSVQFVGISRALPAVEQRVLRTHFVGKGKNTQFQYSTTINQVASKILGRNYSGAQRYGSSDIYSLNVVNSGETYSGFNMGAGEDVVFTLLNTLAEVPDSSLVIIEEIETGLHPKAQREIIKYILNTAYEKHLQIIMTTHSQLVLESLPPEGRVLLKKSGGEAYPEYCISGNYAFSALLSENIPELTIYVEDDIARRIILEALPTKLRKRVRIIFVGSWIVVTSQIAAFYRDGNLGNTLAIYDGDCKISDVKNEFRKLLSVSKLDEPQTEWFECHSLMLPGDEPPEKWLMNKTDKDEFCESFALTTNSDYEEVNDILRSPYHGDHHDYFYFLSEKLGLPESQVKLKFIELAIGQNKYIFNDLLDKVELLLGGNLVRV